MSEKLPFFMIAGSLLKRCGCIPHTPSSSSVLVCRWIMVDIVSWLMNAVCVQVSSLIPRLLCGEEETEPGTKFTTLPYSGLVSFHLLPFCLLPFHLLITAQCHFAYSCKMSSNTYTHAMSCIHYLKGWEPQWANSPNTAWVCCMGLQIFLLHACNMHGGSNGH